MQKCESKNKDVVRKKAYTLRKELFANTQHYMELSLQIQGYIINSKEYQSCDFLCVYASVNGEVSTNYLIEESFKNKKKILFPRCHAHEKGIMHYALSKRWDDLRQELYNIPEPKKHCPIIDVSILNSQKTLIIVPALAFDTAGFRLGYGQGYYDRFMEKVPHAVSMGLAFSDHVYEELPRMEWDKTVNFLATELGIRSIDIA